MPDRRPRCVAWALRRGGRRGLNTCRERLKAWERATQQGASLLAEYGALVSYAAVAFRLCSQVSGSPRFESRLRRMHGAKAIALDTAPI